MSSDSSVATTASARALASRINGAKSRGPRTVAGKARSSRNALKHGLCARTYLLLPDERAAEFAAFRAALISELAPAGALQIVLAERIAVAAWRLARADRLEAEALAFRMRHDGTSGIAVLRDGNGTRAVETMLRYRNAALVELLRCQRTLAALQAAARANAGTPAPAPALRRGRARPRPKDMPPKRTLAAGPPSGRKSATRIGAAPPATRASPPRPCSSCWAPRPNEPDKGY
jgi:hypothetical protein